MDPDRLVGTGLIIGAVTLAALILAGIIQL